MATLTLEAHTKSKDAPKEPMIEVRKLIKRFAVGEGEVTVLKDISFQVNRGEFLSVVGPSGSGKSTLINMFTGIDRPSEG